MGSLKPLLPLADRPVIRWGIDALLAAGVDDIVVVLGPNGAEIAATIDSLPLTVAWNLEPASDMAGSVRTGLSALRADASAVLVCLADHPLVSAATMTLLMEAHRRRPDKIIIPLHDGRKGHPTLFPRQVLEELNGASTLRDIIRKDPGRIELCRVRDRGVLLDMDTPGDYEEMQTVAAQSGQQP